MCFVWFRRSHEELDQKSRQLSAEDNSLKQELISLKASNETMICENKELSQSLVSLKETNERIESQLKELTQEINSTEKRFVSDFLLKSDLFLDF